MPKDTHIIRNGDPHLSNFALTFDGGGTSNGTESILDVLKREGIRATFFLTGPYIRSYPDLVRRMISEGHEIGNHTETHPVLIEGDDAIDRWLELSAYAGTTRKGMDFASFRRELESPESAFQEIGQQKMSPIWRSPFGFYSDEINRWAAELGYSTNVLWTHYFGDMEGRDKREMIHSLSDFLEGDVNEGRGAILLGHLGTLDKRLPHLLGQALPYMIDMLQERDLAPLTITEMIGGDHGA